MMDFLGNKTEKRLLVTGGKEARLRTTKWAGVKWVLGRISFNVNELMS